MIFIKILAMGQNWVRKQSRKIGHLLVLVGPVLGSKNFDP